MPQKGWKIRLFYWSGCGWLWASVELIEQRGSHSFESFKRQQGERWPEFLYRNEIPQILSSIKKRFSGGELLKSLTVGEGDI